MNTGPTMSIITAAGPGAPEPAAADALPQLFEGDVEPEATLALEVVDPGESGVVIGMQEVDRVAGGFRGTDGDEGERSVEARASSARLCTVVVVMTAAPRAR